jgi:tetratricopeptide (TPR) repeat protein
MASQKMKKYDLALDKYRKALNLTSSPEVYIRQGECLMETGQYNEAIQSCSTALNIAPSRLLPRYTLMKIHERQMDTVQVLRMAHELINQTPKGNSKNADFFKKEALKLIKSYKK